MSEQSENQNQPVTEEASLARISELEGLVARKDEEITLKSSRLVELEQALAESSGKVTAADNALAQAVASYRTLVTRSEPLVPAEMIKGDSIEAIEASLKASREVIGKVKAGLEAEGKVARVPAGAPQRRAANLSTLSPRDKIQRGIS